MQINLVLRYKGEVAEFAIQEIQGEWQIRKLFKLVLTFYKNIQRRDVIRQAEDILKKGGKNGNK
jgi:hypothetical protein